MQMLHADWLQSLCLSCMPLIIKGVLIDSRCAWGLYMQCNAIIDTMYTMYIYAHLRKNKQTNQLSCSSSPPGRVEKGRGKTAGVLLASKTCTDPLLSRDKRYRDIFSFCATTCASPCVWSGLHWESSVVSQCCGSPGKSRSQCPCCCCRWLIQRHSSLNRFFCALSGAPMRKKRSYRYYVGQQLNSGGCLLLQYKPRSWGKCTHSFVGQDSYIYFVSDPKRKPWGIEITLLLG